MAEPRQTARAVFSFRTQRLLNLVTIVPTGPMSSRHFQSMCPLYLHLVRGIDHRIVTEAASAILINPIIAPHAAGYFGISTG